MKHLPQKLHEFECKSFATPKLKQQIAIRLESAVGQTKECVCGGCRSRSYNADLHRHKPIIQLVAKPKLEKNKKRQALQYTDRRIVTT